MGLPLTHIDTPPCLCATAAECVRARRKVQQPAPQYSLHGVGRAGQRELAFAFLTRWRGQCLKPGRDFESKPCYNGDER